MIMRKRVSDDQLNQLVAHEGVAARGIQVSAAGVLRLALDLQETRSAYDQLLSAMAFIKASGHAGSAIMSEPQILDWALEIGWKP
jgi:hypothetical protein